MNSLTGWATQMMFKQQMGGVTDSVNESLSTEAKNPNSRQKRKELEASRAERDAEYAAKKAERGAKKLSVADRWAKNKASNK